MKKEYDFSKGKMGAPLPAEQGKTRITIRLDNEILEWFREKVNEQGGGNYQTLINNALREHMRKDTSLVEMIRQVISGKETFGLHARVTFGELISGATEQHVLDKVAEAANRTLRQHLAWQI